MDADGINDVCDAGLEFHPLASLFPLMDGDDYSMLCLDIKNNGLMQPVWTYHGKILDGRNRYRACRETGVSPRFRVYGGEDPVGFVVSLNLHRRHLNESQRAMVAANIANLKVGRPSDIPQICGISQSKAADLMKVSTRSVGQAAKVRSECAPEVVLAVETGTVAVSAATLFTELPEEAQVSLLSNLLEQVGGGKLTSARVKKGVKVLMGQTSNIHVSDDSYEWYTPKEYIDAAKELMGGIDLDPASSAAAQDIVQASRFYTKEEDGLSGPWQGRVWINPPYSAALVSAFVARLYVEFEAKSVQEALLLVNNSTDTQWFHELMFRCPICFTRGRVKFWGPDKGNLATRQGQAIFYLGDRPRQFAEVFSRFGTVVTLL